MYCTYCIILLIMELVTLWRNIYITINFSNSVSYKRRYWILKAEKYLVQLHSPILFSRQRSLIFSIFSAHVWSQIWKFKKTLLVWHFPLEDSRDFPRNKQFSHIFIFVIIYNCISHMRNVSFKYKYQPSIISPVVLVDLNTYYHWCKIIYVLSCYIWELKLCMCYDDACESIFQRMQERRDSIN